MVICVSEELQDIKQQLEIRGYKVVSDASICDIIICNLKNSGLINLNIQNNIKTEGTLIIDSGKKTIEEIEYIINNRIYSSLF